MTTTTTVDLANDRAHEALDRRFYVPFNTGKVDLYDILLASDWVDDPLAPGQRPGLAGLKDRLDEVMQHVLARADAGAGR